MLLTSLMKMIKKMKLGSKYQTLKLLFDIMLIITALFKRAPAIALALLINTCSTSYQTYKSYRLKEEDVKRQMKRKEEMEMTPLQQISTNKYPVRRQQEPFQDGNSYLLKCLKRVISFYLPPGVRPLPFKTHMGPPGLKFKLYAHPLASLLC